MHAAEGREQRTLKPQRRKNANDAIIEFVPAQKSAMNYELDDEPNQTQQDTLNQLTCCEYLCELRV